MTKKNIIIVAGALILCIAMGFLYCNFIHSDIKLKKSSKGITVNYINKFPDASYRNLSDITEEEIWSDERYDIVEGTVEEIRNVKIRFGTEKYYGAIITIKPEEIIKGTLNETQIKIFVDCNIGKADSSGDSEILKTLKEKDRGIFIIYKYSDTDVWENDKKNLYMDELAEYGFEDAERFAFIEKIARYILVLYTKYFRRWYTGGNKRIYKTEKKGTIMSKVAIVTGSSRGIGRACALRLAKEGMDVVVNYNSNEAEAMKVVNAIKDMGQDVIAIKANTR